MSAFIVGRATIDCLVTEMVRRGMLADEDTPDALGSRLWSENYASVNHRYRVHDAAPFYAHSERSEPLDVVYKQARCFRYQSCEHEGWISSEARAMIEWLISLCERDGASPKSAAYEAAPWGID